MIIILFVLIVGVKTETLTISVKNVLLLMMCSLRM